MISQLSLSNSLQNTDMHASISYYPTVPVRNKSTLENTAATFRGSNPPPPNLIASHEPNIQKQSYHPWIRARDDVSYHHFRLHLRFTLSGDGRGGGRRGKRKKKKRSQSKRKISPHQHSDTRLVRAEGLKSIKKGLESLNLPGTNSTR